ncbi:mucin-2-like isoform X1, partial [Clarias magur]
SAEGASLPTLKAANVDTYDFTMDITNRIYTDSLLNPTSNDYNIMYEEVSGV